MLKDVVLADEYKDLSSLILCNDCGHRSRTAYHFMYHLCQNTECKSANSTMLHTISNKSHHALLPDMFESTLEHVEIGWTQYLQGLEMNAPHSSAVQLNSADGPSQ